MFDTYLDTVKCPGCGVEFEASVHDMGGDRAMRIFRPHDLVPDRVGERLSVISEEVRCPSCDRDLVVRATMVRGIVVHFDEQPPDPDDPDAMLRFVERSVVACSQRRGELEHVLDVVLLSLRLWTGDPSMEIGEQWHVEEPGLPRLWKGMPASTFASSLLSYLGSKIRCPR